MPDYRRVIQEGGIYFFTIVTYQRQKIFSLPETRKLLLQSIDHVRIYHPFKIKAFCILLDHVHFLWRMPENDSDYSMRINQIKRRFSKQYIARFGMPIRRSESREKRREVTIWQRRFWEHWIHNEGDLIRHIDYIHYNPVKHGLVPRVCDWESSSFHDYVRKGYYDLAWGEEIKINEKKYQHGE